ncbi:MAG: hypothetical protein ACLQDV_29815 [Candidatus Binataceae bacterium]
MDINQPITGPAVWKGPEAANDPSWVYRLSRDEIAEFDSAIVIAKRAGGSTSATTVADNGKRWKTVRACRCGEIFLTSRTG